MDLSNINYVDLGVFVLLATSGVFAFRRGFIKEIFALGTWIAASIIAAAYYPSLTPWMKAHVVSQDLAAQVAAVVALFCLTLIVLIPLGNWIAGLIKGPTMTSLDHSLGLAFGLLRGFLVLCLVFLCVTWVWPKEEDQPKELTEAKSRPLLAYGADMLKGFLPKDEQERIVEDLRKSREATERAVEDAKNLDAISTPMPGVTKGKSAPTSNGDEDRNQINSTIDGQSDN